MTYFVQATEHDMNKHAKFGDLILYGFLSLISSRFDFFEFSTRQQCTDIDLVKPTA
jgi:hypothetical protein